MSDEHGRYSISRKVHLPLGEGGDIFWNEARVFHRWEAWQDLIQRAAFADHESLKSGERIRLRRGEFYASIRFLASRWSWSKSRVQRFLTMLQDMNRIAGQSRDGQRDTYLLVNYDTYQYGRDTRAPERGTVAGQSRDKEEEGEEVTTTNNPLSIPVPEPTAKAVAKTAKDTVWSAFLAAHESYYLRRNGQRPRAPALTKTRGELILARLREYPVEDVVDATRGIFLSPHHCGDNDRGETYLSLELALAINRERNNLERFRDLYRKRKPADEGSPLRPGMYSPTGKVWTEEGQWADPTK